VQQWTPPVSDFVHVALTVQVGGSTVGAAIQEATGVSKARLGELYKQLGDIGDVAAACKRTQVRLGLPLSAIPYRERWRPVPS
jgi:hypothetical protein